MDRGEQSDHGSCGRARLAIPAGLVSSYRCSRPLVALLSVVLIALGIAVALPGQGEAAGPKGKRVAVKEFVGNPNLALFPPYRGSVRWNAGWRAKGRGIKEAWVRFTIGGSARECVGEDCRDGIGVVFSRQATCTRRSGAPVTVPRAKQGFVPVGPESQTNTFVTADRIKLPKPRTSCEIQAGIVATDDFYFEDYGVYDGTIRVKIEVFVKK